MAQVLIVENEPEESLILGTIVEQAGHEVDFASGGEEALKKIDLKTSIDVVITDLDMPKGHGLKLIMTLRTLYPEVGIIAVSATGPEQLAMAVAVGATAVLGKPVDPDELVEVLAQAAPADTSPVRGQASS